MVRVNQALALRQREQGMSVAEIARRQGVTESAIYYTLKPEKRRTETPVGKTRSVYMRDELWDVLKAHGAKYGKSASAVLTEILEGELPLPAKLAERLDGPLLSAVDWSKVA